MNNLIPAVGKVHWVVPEGFIPAASHGKGPEFESHEALCVINTAPSEAHLELTIFFTDREPVGPYRFTVAAQRSKHIRMNTLNDPEPVPKDTEYSSLIVSDTPIVVQHTRLDSRQAELALMSTIAFGSDYY
jgi:hypothetical protein